MHPPHPKTIILIGPTAGGKSKLAVELAERIGGEIIGADSMQVYRHLDAGTAKPEPALRKRVPHHLIDIAEPGDRYTVHDWLRDAEQKIATLHRQNTAAVVVGGTNLYVKALLEGLFDGPGQDEDFRQSIQAIDAAELHRQLAEVDPDAAARIAPADRQRITRALEVFHLTGETISSLQTQWREQQQREHPLRYDAVMIGLRWSVDSINSRINQRVKMMFYPAIEATESLPREVSRLVEAGALKPGDQGCEALGYKQTLAALYPEIYPACADPKIKTIDDAFERTKILPRRFAKQQRTWLKRFRDVHWIDMPCDDALKQAISSIRM